MFKTWSLFVSWFLVFGFFVYGAGCNGGHQPANQPAVLIKTGKNMQLTSPAFGHNQPLPAKYTCDGQNISPPLAWDDLPSTTKSLVLLVDDPDAPSGDFVHWVVFDIPSTITSIDEGQKPPGIVGKSTLKTNAYVSPCPPSGTHRYIFKLYALDRILSLTPSATKADVLAAIKDHVLDQAELVSTYKR